MTTTMMLTMMATRVPGTHMYEQQRALMTIPISILMTMAMAMAMAMAMTTRKKSTTTTMTTRTGALDPQDSATRKRQIQ